MRNRFQYLPVLIPYAAIPIGLYLMHNAWVTVGLYYCAVAFCVVLYRRSDLPRSTLQGGHWLALPIAASAAFLMFGVITLGWPAAIRTGVDVAGRFSSYSLSGPSLAIFAVFTLAVNPVMEELLWRGLVDANPARPSWIDAAFGGYHVLVLALALTLPAIAIAFALLCGASWFLRWTKHAFSGLVVPCVVHFFADLGIILAIARHIT